MGFLLIAIIALIIINPETRADNMWSFCVEFFDDGGRVIGAQYVTAQNQQQALSIALRGDHPVDYADTEVTRL